jgi:MYXO-CTERM domain-containing protein
MGRYRIRVEASDDRTPATDLGFALSLVDGTLPFTLPAEPVQSFRQPSEDFSTWFSDDGEEFAGTIEVRVVDRAGNMSEPVNVRATGEAVGCGCSMVGMKRPGAAGWLGAFLILSFVRRRRTASIRFEQREPSASEVLVCCKPEKTAVGRRAPCVNARRRRAHQ